MSSLAIKGGNYIAFKMHIHMFMYDFFERDFFIVILFTVLKRIMKKQNPVIFFHANCNWYHRCKPAIFDIPHKFRQIFFKINNIQSYLPHTKKSQIKYYFNTVLLKSLLE